MSLTSSVSSMTSSLSLKTSSSKLSSMFVGSSYPGSYSLHYSLCSDTPPGSTLRPRRLRTTSPIPDPVDGMSETPPSFLSLSSTVFDCPVIGGTSKSHSGNSYGDGYVFRKHGTSNDGFRTSSGWSCTPMPPSPPPLGP